MVKIIILLVVLFLLQLTQVQAVAPQDYSYEQDVVNGYTDYSFMYDLTVLDAATEYSFTFSIVENDGITVVQNLQTIYVTGVTSYLLNFYGQGQPYQIVHAGPTIVRDNYGKIIGRGFIAKPPTDIFSTEAEKRVGIAAAPYQAVAISGYQHYNQSTTPVTTISSDYTLLHYSMPSADYGCYLTGDNKISMHSLIDDVIVAEFPIQELALYNRGTGTTFVGQELLACAESGKSFVVLNTSGNLPSFVDAYLDALNFATGDNPHRLTVDTGIYDYAILDSIDGVERAGESVWIVSSEVPEWTITTRNVVAGGTQKVVITAIDENVWDSYFEQRLNDYVQDDVDTENHTFAESRTISYTTDSTPNALIFVTYYREATALEYYATPEDFNFVSTIVYATTARIHLDQFIIDRIDESPIDNNILKLLLLGGLLAVAMIFFARRSLQLTLLISIVVIFLGMLTLQLPLWANILLGFLEFMLFVMLTRTGSGTTDE